MPSEPRSLPPPPVADPASAWLAAFGAAPEDAPAARAAFAPATLKQALDGALALGRAAGRLPEAMRVLADGELRLAALAARLGLERRAETVGGLACPAAALVTGVGAEAITLAGCWAPDLVERAGGVALGVRAGAPDVAARVADLSGADVVVFALAGLALSEAVAVLEGRLAAPAWRGLRGGGPRGDGPRVFALDGRRFVNSPGPPLVRAAELLAFALHGPASGVAPEPGELVPLTAHRPPHAPPP